MAGETKQYNKSGSAGDALFGMGLIGALIFYTQQAEGFWSVVIAILKAFVWPAFLVYDALKSLA